MKKILITGGAGFIGSHLTDRLLQEGNAVVVYDNLSLGRLSNLSEARKSPHFAFVEGDILDEAALGRLFKEYAFDSVFHFAANSDIARSVANPDVDLNSTFLTTYRVLCAMRKAEVKSITFASTSAVYGDAKGKAVCENFGPLFPISHYGAGKLASEAFISSFVENYGMSAHIVRFPNVTGERATHGVIYDFVRKLRKNPNELEVLGDGTQAKPYLYVKDLVDAVLFVRAHMHDRLNVCNVGVETQTTVATIATQVIERMGLPAKIRYTGGNRGWVGDVPKFAYDVSRLHALGWRAKLTSDEAICKAIDYILKYDL